MYGVKKVIGSVLNEQNRSLKTKPFFEFFQKG